MTFVQLILGLISLGFIMFGLYILWSSSKEEKIEKLEEAQDRDKTSVNQNNQDSNSKVLKMSAGEGSSKIARGAAETARIIANTKKTLEKALASRKAFDNVQKHNTAIVDTRKDRDLEESHISDGAVALDEELRKHFMEIYASTNFGWLMGATKAVTDDGKFVIDYESIHYLTSELSPIVMPDGTIRVTGLVECEEAVLFSKETNTPLLRYDKHKKTVVRYTPDELDKFLLSQDELRESVRIELIGEFESQITEAKSESIKLNKLVKELVAEKDENTNIIAHKNRLIEEKEQKIQECLEKINKKNEEVKKLNDALENSKKEVGSLRKEVNDSMTQSKKEQAQKNQSFKTSENESPETTNAQNLKKEVKDIQKEPAANVSQNRVEDVRDKEDAEGILDFAIDTKEPEVKIEDKQKNSQDKDKNSDAAIKSNPKRDNDTFQKFKEELVHQYRASIFGTPDEVYEYKERTGFIGVMKDNGLYRLTYKIDLCQKYFNDWVKENSYDAQGLKGRVLYFYEKSEDKAFYGKCLSFVIDSAQNSELSQFSCITDVEYKRGQSEIAKFIGDIERSGNLVDILETTAKDI